MIERLMFVTFKRILIFSYEKTRAHILYFLTTCRYRYIYRHAAFLAKKNCSATVNITIPIHH